MRIEINDINRTVEIRDGASKRLTLEELIEEFFMPAALALGYESKLVQEHLSADYKWAQENLSEEREPAGKLGGYDREALEEWWEEKFGPDTNLAGKALYVEDGTLTTVGDAMQVLLAERDDHREQRKKATIELTKLKRAWAETIAHLDALDREANPDISQTAAHIKDFMSSYFTPEEDTNA